MPRAKIQHDYHLVEPSPWPIIGAVGAFFMLTGAVFWMHGNYDFFGLGLGGHSAVFFGGLALVLYTMAGWWRDIVGEAVALGHHKPIVILGFRYAITLFVIADVMFFSAWIWAYLNSTALVSGAVLGSPPSEWVMNFDPWGLPLFSTLLLLASVTTINWSRHAILVGDNRGAVRGLAVTIVLGICFLGVQAFGYFQAGLAQPTDGALHGSSLFMVMGIYALHVVVGTLMLTVCACHVLAEHFTPQHHFGFEAATWYWYFVITIWLVLFVTLHVWGAGEFTTIAAPN